MRQAPPVGVTCSGGGGWRVVGALLAALAAGVITAWLLQHLGASGAAVLAAACAAVVLAGALAWRWERPRPVDLLWNGRVWRVDGAEGEVDVMLDLGGWMLLRFRPAAGAARWLPLARAEAGAAWHPLRSAVFAVPVPAQPGVEG